MVDSSNRHNPDVMKEEATPREAPLLPDSRENASWNLPVRERLLGLMARANQITAAPSAAQLHQGMIDLMLEVTQAECANFFMLDEASDELVLEMVRGDDESQYLVGLRLNRRQGLPGIAIDGTQPVIIGDLYSDPHWLRTVDLASAARKRNVINLPLNAGGRTLGVVQLFNFQQAELDLLLVLSERLALEMLRQEELDGAKQSNIRLQQLIETLGEVAGTLDRNRLLRLVTEHVARLVDAERSSIFLVDPSTKETIFQVGYRSPEQEQPRSPARAFASQPPANRSQPMENSSQDFTYFNRSAITVSLQIKPLVAEPGAEGSARRSQVLGGLMALNKQNAAFQPEDAHLMQILANQTGTFLQVAEMYESAGELFLDAIRALAAAIDAKDPYTQGHSQRVSDYAVLIARELRLDEPQINDIRTGSLLHDIGKIGIPDAILLKQGKLTPAEFEVMKRHASTGVNILSQVRLLEPVLPGIAEHHERLDGSGYPAHKCGDQISLMGRIIAVADVFDAMTSNRPYRAALSAAAVLEYLKEHSGAQFDASCVQALNNILWRANQADGG